MAVGNFVPFLWSLVRELAWIGEWEWQEPAWLFLLLLLPLMAAYPLRGRTKIRHPESWLFFPGTGMQIREAALRYGSAFFLALGFAALLLTQAHPARVISSPEPQEHHVIAGHVIDVSGSMNGTDYFPVLAYFRNLFRLVKGESPAPVAPIEIGLYFFSSKNLLHMFPSTAYPRQERGVKRFTPGVLSYHGWDGESDQFGPGTFQGESFQLGLGAAGGTEPGPSLWEMLVDLVRAEDPSLVRPLQSLRERNALTSYFSTVTGMQATPMKDFFRTRESWELLIRLRGAAKGKRIVFLTDSEFAMDGQIAVSRVLELAALIELPVELLTIKEPKSMTENLPKYITGTGGSVHMIKGPGHSYEALTRTAAEEIVKRLRADAPAQTEPRLSSSINPVPQSALIAIALIAFSCWCILRTHVIVGW